MEANASLEPAGLAGNQPNPLTQYLLAKEPLDYDSVHFLKLIQKHSRQVDVVDESCLSPLFVALKQGNEDAAEIIYETARENKIQLKFNRIDEDKKSMLQVAIQSNKRILFSTFVQEGKDRISRITPGLGKKSIFEWIYHSVSASPGNKIYFIMELLKLRFPVPKLLKDVTLVEALIELFKNSEIGDSEAIFKNSFEDTTLALDYIKELSNVEEDSERSLFTQVSGGQNVIHLCCILNLPELLEYFLSSLKEIDQELCQMLLQESNLIGLPPIFICVYPPAQSPQKSSRERSIKECVAHLLDYGENINGSVPEALLTPLHFCVVAADTLPQQIEMAVYLLENGASVDIPDDDNLTCLYYALMSLHEEFIDAAIKAEAFKPTDSVRHLKLNPMQLLVLGYFNNGDEDSIKARASKCARIARKLHQYGCEIPSWNDISRLFISHKDARCKILFSELQKIGVFNGNDCSTDLSSPLITSVLIDDMQFFRFALMNDFSVQTPLLLDIGSLTAPNRMQMRSQAVHEEITINSLESMENNLISCRICCSDIKYSTKKSVLIDEASGESVEVCSECQFFSAPDNKNLSAFEIAKRKRIPSFMNLLHFMEQTSVGADIKHRGNMELLDVLMNAKIFEKEILLNLGEDDLCMLGIAVNVSL